MLSRLNKLLSYFFCNPKIIALIFFVFLFISSLGMIANWVIFDAVSMSDNFLFNGSFYPDKQANYPFGVSDYFPGLSLISFFLTIIGINYYIGETMLLIACLTTISFLAILG